MHEDGSDVRHMMHLECIYLENTGTFVQLGVVSKAIALDDTRVCRMLDNDA